MNTLCCSSDERIDRISNLPDSIMDHIVSFLPTEEGFKTIFLSKLWRQVFSSLSNLDFDQRRFKSKDLNQDSFKEFVGHVLHLHRGSSVQRFKLCIDVDKSISPLQVNTWISFAVQHSVQIFEFRLASGLLENLPSCLFTCSTLTMLQLENIDLKLPTSISFPVLKTASLYNVNFFDGYLTNNLFSSHCCPVLEELTLFSCNFEESYDLIISSSTIKNLVLFFNPNPNIQNIQISTLNLRELFYLCNVFPSISSDQVLSSLFSVVIGVDLPPVNNDFVVRASQILARLCNVASLSLNMFYTEILTRNEGLVKSLPPSLCSLKIFKLQYYPTKNQMQVITLLLKSYPNLETLHISICRGELNSLNMRDMDEYWKSKDLPMECVLKQLRDAQVHIVEGNEHEVELVRFVLENASILETMKIIYTKELRADAERQRISEELLELARGSPDVIFSFSSAMANGNACC